MARSTVSRGSYVRRRTSKRWPQAQFNAWIIFIVLTASVILGIFAQFLQIQSRMRLAVPWLFPFGVTVGALTIFLVLLLLVASSQGKLTPEVLMLIAFILGVLFITGAVETGIQLFGEGQVSKNCQTYVAKNGITGSSVYTLAWLQQNNICSCWYAAFAFWIIGALIFVWLFIFAIQVNNGAYD